MKKQQRVQEISAELARIADYPSERISESTRIYHDAGLSGDEFYDFIIWFSQKYSVAVDGMDLSTLRPNEGDFSLFPFRKKYLALSVGDLAELSEAKSWKDSGIQRRLSRV